MDLGGAGGGLCSFDPSLAPLHICRRAQGVDSEKEYSWAEGMLPNPPAKLPCWKGAEKNHAAVITNQTAVKVGDEAQLAAAVRRAAPRGA
eukprot:SAG11_NODE_3666_length_2300_cov_1.850522_2_plen_90_part_00